MIAWILVCLCWISLAASACLKAPSAALMLALAKSLDTLANEFNDPVISLATALATLSVVYKASVNISPIVSAILLKASSTTIAVSFAFFSASIWDLLFGAMGVFYYKYQKKLLF